jgi:Cu(I)/Ag(I) efflux system periplasmic protein CusF
MTSGKKQTIATAHITASLTTLVAGLLGSAAIWAQTPSTVPNAAAPATPAVTATAATSTAQATATAIATDLPWISGDVRRVDPRAGKVTLKHGAITNLDMPPMTMVFAVADPALLKDLQVGARIEFSVDQIQGQYTVLRWRQQK